MIEPHGKLIHLIETVADDACQRPGVDALPETEAQFLAGKLQGIGDAIEVIREDARNRSMDRQRELLLHQITALLTECTARPDGDEWLENMGRAVAAVRAGVSLGIGTEITRDANIRIGHYVKENPDVKVGPILDELDPWLTTVRRAIDMSRTELSARRDNGDKT